MCRPNEDCDSDKAARGVVGEWVLTVTKRDAHDVAFIQATMRASGKRAPTLGDVLRHCLRLVATHYAESTVFNLTEGGDS